MTGATFELISTGIVLGLIAGISPGPLLTLVISETLKNGKVAGIRMALVPVITDLPIVVFSLLILSKLANYEIILGVISLLGSGFLVYLALENILAKPKQNMKSNAPNFSIVKGVISNFLSPHPYLFWILVGGSIILKASEISRTLAVLFVFLFYVCLIGSKLAIALLVDKFSNILSTNIYLYLIRVLGALLLILAVYFFTEGVNYIF